MARASGFEGRDVPGAVVVGAGPNGLAAAVALARAGHRATVLEARDEIGGGTRTEALTRPGFLHDVCSAVHPMALSSPFFRELPLAEHGLEWVQPPAPLAHPFDDGSAVLLERSVEETAEGLDPEDREAYRELMGPFVPRWDELAGEVLAPPLQLPEHPLLLGRFGLRAMRSATGLARSRFSGPRARALFCGVAAHTLEPIDRIPTAAFGLVLGLSAHAVGWPVARGGSQRIADALAAVLERLGGEVRTGLRVRSLDEIPAGAAVFLDLTPREVLRVCGDRLPDGYRGQLERYRYGPGVFKMDWALSEPIPWRSDACRRAGTVHLGGTMEEIAASARAAWEGRPHELPFVILSQPTLFDPSRAPEGRHTAWGYVHVPHGSDRDFSDRVEAQVERFAPGFRDTILASSTRTAAELERENPNMVGGDLNGGIQDLRQMLFRPAVRLVPYTTPLEHVYLCSSSTPPGGAVHGMCGYHAVRAALKRMG